MKDARREHAAWFGVAVGAVLLLTGGEARADTKQECLAAYDQTQVLRDAGKLVEARRNALACAVPECPGAVVKECTQWLAQLEASIPTVVFVATDAAGATVTLARVTVDGQALERALEGKALPMNPGRHELRIHPAGGAAIVKDIVVIQGQKNQKVALVIPNGKSVPAPAVPPPAVSPPDAAPPDSRPAAAPTPGASAQGPQADTKPRLGGQRIGGIVVGSVGVVGLVIGAAFGGMAISRKNTALSVCPNLCTTPVGVNEWNDAVTAGNVGTAGFVIGGVALATGIVILATAPRSAAQARAQVGLGLGSFTLRGTF